MNKKTIITITAVTAVIALVVLRLVNNKETIDQRAEKAIEQQTFSVIPVKTTTVKILSLGSQLVQTGTFSAKQDYKLNAQALGQINSLHVKKSQYVTKGTLLATIDNSALLSQLATAKASLENAEQDARRMKNALASGGVTQQQVDNAELQVKSAQSSLSQVQQQTANFRIIAPANGVINDIFVNTESSVAPGTPILELVDITKVTLTVSVVQELVPVLRLGQRVKVTTDVYPEFVFDGKVETINVKADASQKISVGISVDNTREHPLLVGMFGRAEFIADGKNLDEGILYIPRAAIVGSIQDAKVFVVRSDSTVTLRKIETGRSRDNKVEIIKGLAEGDQVVTAGQINLEDGTKVLIKN